MPRLNIAPRTRPGITKQTSEGSLEGTEERSCEGWKDDFVAPDGPRRFSGRLRTRYRPIPRPRVSKRGKNDKTWSWSSRFRVNLRALHNTTRQFYDSIHRSADGGPGSYVNVHALRKPARHSPGSVGSPPTRRVIFDVILRAWRDPILRCPERVVESQKE